MISGERVRQARELRGLTQTQLAAAAQVSQSAIAHFEGMRSSPTDEVVDKIALRTGFPPSFFKQGGPPQFALGSLLFRSRSSASSRQRAIVHRHAQVAFECASRMAQQVDPLPLRLPQPAGDPLTAARLTRASIGLSPDTPIDNLLRAVERAGVLVLALPLSMGKVDAFSVWTGANPGLPVIIVLRDAPGDRLRFSAAHELGHLVLHQAMKGRVADVERQADHFAAELLLPEAAMLEELHQPITLTSVSALKRRWGVSMQALIRRAHDLGLITRRQYGYMFGQLSARGWRKVEPPELQVAVERPRALRKMAELLYGDPIDHRRFAADMRITESLARAHMEAYAGNGNSQEADDETSSPGGKPLRFPGTV